MSKRAMVIYNAVSFQLVWWLLVLEGNAALSLASLLLVVHFMLSPARKADAILMMKIGVIGITVDALLTVLGVFQFTGTPWWLALLWLHLGICFRYSLAFLVPLPVLVQALIGAAAGCLSYLAGAKFDAVILPYDTPASAIILFCLWCLLLPLLVYLANPYGRLILPFFNCDKHDGRKSLKRSFLE